MDDKEFVATLSEGSRVSDLRYVACHLLTVYIYMVLESAGAAPPDYILNQNVVYNALALARRGGNGNQAPPLLKQAFSRLKVDVVTRLAEPGVAEPTFF